MRVAIVTDIHGNLTAFEAVLADLRAAAPDLVLHGGDLADSGAGAVEIADRIRDLGWPGVYGNTDEMLFDKASLIRFLDGLAMMPKLRDAIVDMADWSRERLGPARIDWLSKLPASYVNDGIALVHASTQTAWRAPGEDAGAEEASAAFGSLGRRIVIYGHIHRPFVREMPAFTLVNSGSVGMPYDGDPRASYVLIDQGKPSIRRVDYDVDREIRAVLQSGVPHASWWAAMLQSALPALP